ncbi:hypothetical protein SFRURICE_008233 [Spodoptera frugiperda]|nr:hypothetical protein SFRURICE_008233 [Spodoptera frugiperda]
MTRNTVVLRFVVQYISAKEPKPLRIVRTAHKQYDAMRTDDVIRIANAKNPSESGVGNQNAADTADVVNPFDAIRPVRTMRTC